MAIEGEYRASPWDWVRNQVEAYESSGGHTANMLGDSDWPVVIVTCRGNRTGAIRKFALMRVEHDGEYALVASLGGAPMNPNWYHNLVADPTALMIQDGGEAHDYVARQVEGDERTQWWDRAVKAFPSYAEYQGKTTRKIPVLVAKRAKPWS